MPQFLLIQSGQCSIQCQTLDAFCGGGEDGGSGLTQEKQGWENKELKIAPLCKQGAGGRNWDDLGRVVRCGEEHYFAEVALVIPKAGIVCSRYLGGSQHKDRSWSLISRFHFPVSICSEADM